MIRITDTDVCTHQLQNEFQISLPPQQFLQMELQIEDRVHYWKDQFIRYFEQSDAVIFEEKTLLELGDMYMFRADYETGSVLYQLNTVQYPGSIKSWEGLAEANLRLGKYSAALQYYFEILELNPEHCCALSQIDLLSQKIKLR